MVQWSPDTVKAQHGGYFYDDTALKGFSLTHLSGAGCSTYGDIPFIPYVGEVTTSPATDPSRYTSKFSHANEHATAGQYDVTLDSGAKVELATTARTGSGRFTYPAGAASTLLVNTSGSVMGTDDASITIGEDSISGWATSGGYVTFGNLTGAQVNVQVGLSFVSFAEQGGSWDLGPPPPPRSRNCFYPRISLSRRERCLDKEMRG